MRYRINDFEIREFAIDLSVTPNERTDSCGSVFEVGYMNSDAIVSVVNRVNSPQGIQFSHFATQLLQDGLVKLNLASKWKIK